MKSVWRTKSFDFTVYFHNTQHMRHQRAFVYLVLGTQTQNNSTPSGRRHAQKRSRATSIVHDLLSILISNWGRHPELKAVLRAAQRASVPSCAHSI